MVDFSKLTREGQVKDMKENFKPWICQEFMVWCRYGQGPRWPNLQANKKLLEAPESTEEVFEKALIDFEILWLRAVADYKYDLRKAKYS